MAGCAPCAKRRAQMNQRYTVVYADGRSEKRYISEEAARREAARFEGAYVRPPSEAS